MTEQPAGALWSRTFVGLLIAQFLAAFNDQAIHAAAMFFAINQHALTEASAISLMPILFYAPWALFCTLAGYLADRYSKRNSLVAWKFAEVGVCAVAMTGFWLGDHGWHGGPWVVLATVFLMGTHSAFFVPAKYGAMPEILPPHLLSKGNGVLESLSFLAVILGTVSGGVMSFLFLGHEIVIGLILLGLAAVGAVASLMIRKIPAANPGRPFPAYLYGPLWSSLKTLLSTPPLRFAVAGIAFFTFVVAFMRATVYMLGESQNPRWDELKTSAVVGTVALGIGLGSPLAGWLSGRKIGLGLVPIGALGMIAGCLAAGKLMENIPVLVGCIVLIGFSTGFYIVPLFTLLQYRAPKASKGDAIATSNFINVTGAILASLTFFLVVGAAKKLDVVPRMDEKDLYTGELVRLEFERGRPVYFELETEEGKPRKRAGRLSPPSGPKPRPLRQIMAQLFGDNAARRDRPVIEVDRDVTPREGDEPGTRVSVSFYKLQGVRHYEIRPASDEAEASYDYRRLPGYLFAGAGVMTLGTLLLLVLLLPDLPRRSAWLVRGLFRRKPLVSGAECVPAGGPVILVLGSDEPWVRRTVASSVERYTAFANPSGGLDAVAEAVRQLGKGRLVAVDGRSKDAAAFVAGVCDRLPAAVIAVAVEGGNGNGNGNGCGRVEFGEPVRHNGEK
jgi:MFS family permease